MGALPDPATLLRDLVAAPGPEIDIARAALACAALDRLARGGAALDLAPYLDHLDGMAADMRAQGDGTPPALLAAVLAGDRGYRGDRDSYDDLANADLARVIDRRRGLPVALSILWMHAARARGWRCAGVNMPAHFLLRLEAGGASWIVDPFAGGATLDARDLDALVARVRGPGARPRAEDLAAVDDRSVLLRLQNNIRLRLREVGDAQGALDATGRMLVVAPRSTELWMEASGLNAELGAYRAALDCLDSAMALAEAPAARQRIAAERARLAGRLN
jgi:regulator of sirC expression with transglutaminase-like and TPR domain